MIIMELEVFLEMKLTNVDCPFDAKSIDVILFLSYIFAQTVFVLKTNQVKRLLTHILKGS